MTIGRGAGRLVLDISEADDPAEVGEEALDLGGRARDGLPVPAGFCVTTCAYRLSLIGISLPTGRKSRKGDKRGGKAKQRKREKGELIKELLY